MLFISLANSEVDRNKLISTLNNVLLHYFFNPEKINTTGGASGSVTMVMVFLFFLWSRDVTSSLYVEKWYKLNLRMRLMVLVFVPPMSISLVLQPPFLFWLTYNEINFTYTILFGAKFWPLFQHWMCNVGCTMVFNGFGPYHCLWPNNAPAQFCCWHEPRSSL